MKKQTKGTHEAEKRSKFRRHYEEILRTANLMQCESKNQRINCDAEKKVKLKKI